MHVLITLLLFIVNAEGSAVTGNPIHPFTDEDEIKAVISQLEDALIDKNKIMVTACLSEGMSNRKVNEVKANFAEHVVEIQSPEDKPLVCLQQVKVEIDDNKAVATLTAFSYGNGKRIKAIHRIPFRCYNDEWFIDDAEAVSVILKQIGGIVPVQERAPKVIYDELVPVVPAEKKKEKTEHMIEVIPVDPGEVEEPPAETTTTQDTEDAQ